MSPRTLAGRHAFITGAGSGIGTAIAHALHQAGAHVSLVGRRMEPLAQLASALGAPTSLALPHTDVTDAAAIAQAINTARAKFGPVDILINNAGQAPSAAFDKTTPETWAQVLAVDLTSVFTVTQAVLADLRMRGPGARIINIASTAGLKGYAYTAAYCAAKHGVVGLTRALAIELAATGITVNAVCPGFTDTPMVRQAAATVHRKTGRDPTDILAGFAATNPLGRLIKPEEVANAVLWLASPGSDAINGQAIVVAGGEVMAG